MGAAVKNLARQFGLGRALAMGLLGLLVALRVWDPAPLQLLRFKALDFYQQINPRDPGGQFPVLIVDIDEPSLQRYGQWPWPRDIVAALIDGIAQRGSVAIGLDIVFAEPDRTSPGLMVNRIPNLSALARREILRAPNLDDVLAAAIARSRVVLGQSAQTDRRRKVDMSKIPKTAIATIGKKPGRFLQSYPELLPNIDVLERAAAGRGLFTIQPDADGVVRRVSLIQNIGGHVMPSLAVDLLRVATGGSAIAVKTNDEGVYSVVVAGVEIATNGSGQIWPHFGPNDKRRYVSAQDILSGKTPAQRVAGRLVLIGTTASSLFDLKSTPVSSVLPGVEAQAQVIENILTRSYLQRPLYLIGAEVLGTIALSLLILGLVPLLGPLPVLLLGIVISGAAGWFSWYLFTDKRILLDITYPMLSSFVIYLLLIFSNYLREERDKKQIRGAFKRYLAPAFVEELASDPSRLKLGGERRELTIMFSDVRGFTAISEQFSDDPQGLTRLMNQLLTPVSEAIMEARGTIDKYMGDAVMAFWNAPMDDPHHDTNACRAALDMQVRIACLNVKRQEEANLAGRPFLPIKIGIGLNTGDCVVGNMGSDMRFDYSVLGDAVNLASRLEGASKTYGVDIILGEKTAATVNGEFAVLEMDLLRVKGKEQPTRVFGLFGANELAQSTAFRQLADANAHMIAAYRERDFKSAQGYVGACRALGKEVGVEGLCDLYEARIADFIKTPPPEGWDGVYVATSK